MVTMVEERQLRPGVREIIRSDWVIAADLGQAADPTAIAVLEHRRIFHLTWQGHETEQGETFDVRHLARLPLGLSYPEQASLIAALIRRPPLCHGCEFVIDATGVGRPVADIFEQAGMKPIRVTITAGDKQTWAGPRMWHVAKTLLVSAVDARLNTEELRFASDLQEAGPLADELKDFRRKVSTAGRYSYEARVGRHDDLVLAVALALWAVTTKPKPSVAQTGHYVWR